MAELDKEAFMAAVVHDMRAPLNACLMSLSLIELKASQPADVLKAVEVIRRNLERQAILIDDLSDALEMVGGGLGVDLEDADLADIAETAAEAAGVRTGAEIRWAGRRPTALPISADPERLTRAIGTLLEIVLAGIPAGAGVELAASEAGDRLRLEIRGAGARAGANARPAAGKRPVMRLTVASEIVGKHGGRLEVEDARASVELPRR